jgi:hypothetical protein
VIERIVYEMPIDVDDLQVICNMLRAEGVFSPSFDAPEVDLYDPIVYLEEARRFGTQGEVHLDRNVLSRVVAIAKGGPPSLKHRHAAAFMAFALCADLQIEPNIALYELASCSGQEASRNELGWFRRADDAHPRHWAAVALGRTS